MHGAVEDKRVFVFGHKFLVLAAVRSVHVLELYTVELCGARVRRTVDGELAFAAVTDLTHAVNVLVTVRHIPLIE